MSRELDERIVAMYFDNKNFEKNAQQTIQTLEELKKSTNMEGVEKGFDAFTQAEKKLNLSKLNDSVKNLKTTFGGLGNVLKSSLNVASGPLRSMHSLFNEINGYVTKVAGIDIAGKIVHGVENALRNLTIAPISAGWQQYETTMDSVKTIMSSTGENIDTVKEKLAYLTEYANQTVYSLSDMTSNIGKFTNNGVKLQEATQAMIGLANATADAGQGAAQASMAMYNVSQAIGVGKMTTIDWKSLENANIATTKLKQTFIDAAVASDKLEKRIVKNAQTGEDEIQYWTKAEKGASAMQVTVENFRETLSKGWLDKESMLKTFSIFSGQLSEIEIKALGFSEEEAARLYNIGQEAMAAATEVRTFSKMMDALKESVQSSWATSFEYIFGDMEEGTKLWTELNNKIDEVLTKGSEERNSILLSWRGMMKDENGNVRRIQEVYETRKRMLDVDLEKGYIDAAEYNKRLKLLQDTLGDQTLWTDYRETAISAFLDLFDVIQTVTGAVKGAWTDVFGAFDAGALKNLTQAFRDFVTRIQEWLGSAKDADSRISKLRKGLSGIFAIIKIGVNTVKSVIEIGWAVVRPFIDPLLNLFAKFGEWMNLGAAKTLGEMIQTLADKFKGLWDKLANLGWKGMFDKIGSWISGLWEKLKSGITEWLTDNGFQGVVDWFVGIGDSIKAGYEAVVEWWNSDENKISGFFRGILSSITGLFEVKDGEETTPIAEFFTNLWTDIDQAFQTLKTSWEGSGIPQFFERMWNSIVGLFTPKETTRYNGSMLETTVEDSPIVAFFKNLWSSLDRAYRSLVKWWEGSGIPQFFQGLWDSVMRAFQPVTVTGKMGNTWTEDSPIVKFFKDIGGSIEEAYHGIVDWWNSSGIPQFFEGLWESVVSWFRPVVVTGKMGETWVQNSPIVQFFVDLWEGIKSVYQQLSDWWYNESGIPEFFANMWESVTGLFQPVTVTGKMGNSWEQNSPIVQFFVDLWNGIEDVFGQLSEWWYNDSGIPEFFSGIWDTVSGWFSGKDEQGNEITPPIVQFLQSVWKSISDAWTDIVAWEGWTAIGKFFSDFWGWLVGLFKGSEESTSGADSEKLLKKTQNADELAKAITETMSLVSDVNDQGEKLSGETDENIGLFERIGNFFSGIFKSLADSVAQIGNVPEAQAILLAVSDIIGIISNIIQLVANWLSRVTTGVDRNGNELNAWADYGLPVLGVIAGILLKIYEYKRTTSLAKIADAGGWMSSMGGEFLKMAAAIGIIAVAIRYLGAIPRDQLLQGGITVAAIGVVLAVVISKMKEFSETLTHNNPETSTERIIKHAITAVTIAGVLAETLALLPSILEKLALVNQETNGDAILKIFEGISLMIGTVILSIAIFNKMGASAASVKSAAVGALGLVAGIGILMLGFDAIVETLFGIQEIAGGQYTQDRIKRIRAAGEVMSSLGEAIGGFLGAIGGGLAGGFSAAQGNKLAEGTVIASEILENVSVEQMEHMADVVGILGDIQENLPDYDNIWDKWVNSDKLGIIGDNVGRLGKGLGEMVDAINPADLDPTNDIERLKTYIDLIGNFGSVINILYAAVDQSARFMSNGNPGYTADAIGNTISLVSMYYREAARKLATAIQEGLGDAGADSIAGFSFDAMPIVTAICRSLEQQGKDDIAKAVRAMIQFGLDSYSAPSDLNEAAIHSTGQITEGLTNLFNLMTQNGGELNLSGMLSGFLGELGDTNALNSLFSDSEGAFSIFGETLSNELNEHIHFDAAKWFEVDENGNIPGLADIQTQFDTAIAQMEEAGNMDLTLQIRPVLVMDDFGTEYGKLQNALAVQAPLNLNASVFLGEQKLPIDDTNMVSVLASIRTDMNMNEQSIESALNNAVVSLGYKLNELGDDIAKMKLCLDSDLLVGGISGKMDSALYKRINNAAKTGVSR